MVSLNPIAWLSGFRISPQRFLLQSTNWIWKLCFAFSQFSITNNVCTYKKNVFIMHKPETHFCLCCPCSALKEKKQGKSILVNQVSRWGPVYSQEFRDLYKQGQDMFICFHSHLLATICKIPKFACFQLNKTPPQSSSSSCSHKDFPSFSWCLGLKRIVATHNLLR